MCHCRSAERGTVVRVMVDEGLISASKTTIYEQIKMAQCARNARITQIRAKKRDASLLGLGYKGDYVRPNIRHKVSWKGSIFLMVEGSGGHHGNHQAMCLLEILTLQQLVLRSPHFRPILSPAHPATKLSWLEILNIGMMPRTSHIPALNTGNNCAKRGN